MRRYYEFALVVIVIGVASLFLMERLNAVRDEMEDATVQTEVASIRSQLLEVIAHRETFGGLLPNSENPVDWLAVPIPKYQGAFDQAPEATSVWYFDSQKKQLAYRFRDGHEARFRLNRNTGQGQNKGVFLGVSLQRLADQP